MAAERRWWLILCLMALVAVACSGETSTEVLSGSRQAVDAAPGRVLASATARETVTPAETEVATPAESVVPRGTVPDALAFKGEAADVDSGSAAAPTTTSTTEAPAAADPTTTTSTTTAPVEDPPSETSSTTVAESAPATAPTSGCAAPRFDNGSLSDSVEAVGLVDGDDLDDVVVVGLDADGLIRVVIDFGDGGQSDVGTLASFGEFGSSFRIEFTGNDRRPLRLHRGTESVLAWVADCLPVRAANG